MSLRKCKWSRSTISSWKDATDSLWRGEAPGLRFPRALGTPTEEWRCTAYTGAKELPGRKGPTSQSYSLRIQGRESCLYELSDPIIALLQVEKISRVQEKNPAQRTLDWYLVKDGCLEPRES